MEISGTTCKIISDEDYEDLVKALIIIKKLKFLGQKIFRKAFRKG